MIVQSVLIEGVLDGVAVAASVTAGPELPEEAREHVVRMAIKSLEHQHPGVKDVRQVGDWLVYDMPEDNEEQ